MSEGFYAPGDAEHSSRDNGLTEDVIDRPRLSQMFFETINGHQRLLWPASDDGLFHRPDPALHLKLDGRCHAPGTEKRGPYLPARGQKIYTMSCQRGNAKTQAAQIR